MFRFARPWRHTATVKHLLTEDEDLASVEASMGAIADILETFVHGPPPEKSL